MGADNWGQCPKCKAKAAKDFVKRAEDVVKQYGKVTSAEFLRLSQEAAKRIEVDSSTLREDYEIGIDKVGKFFVSYYGSCDVCGFKHSFLHEEQLKL